MMDFLMKYSGYQFFEILVVILVTAFQVHLVKKLFRSDSILWWFMSNDYIHINYL